MAVPGVLNAEADLPKSSVRIERPGVILGRINAQRGGHRLWMEPIRGPALSFLQTRIELERGLVQPAFQ
jgi:hypothetical protein